MRPHSGCDFFRKLAAAQTCIRTRRIFFSDVDRCFQMASNDYFLFFVIFCRADTQRYADRCSRLLAIDACLLVKIVFL